MDLEPLDLCPLEDVIFGRPCGDIACGEVALVEDAHLVRLEGTDDAMQETSVMKKDEVFVLLFVGGGTRAYPITSGAMAGRCIL